MQKCRIPYENAVANRTFTDRILVPRQKIRTPTPQEVAYCVIDMEYVGENCSVFRK